MMGVEFKQRAQNPELKPAYEQSMDFGKGTMPSEALPQTDETCGTRGRVDRGAAFFPAPRYRTAGAVRMKSDSNESHSDGQGLYVQIRGCCYSVSRRNRAISALNSLPTRCRA